MQELRRLRKQKGLTQAKLAVMADLDPSTLSQIETGARQANMRTLAKLATTLGVGVEDLLPKVQAPLWSDESPTERRPSIFAGAVVAAADRWMAVVSDPATNDWKRFGIAEAASAIGEAVERRVDEASWDSLPNEERRELIRVMEKITEVLASINRHVKDEDLEEKFRQNREKMREWTRRISA